MAKNKNPKKTCENVNWIREDIARVRRAAARGNAGAAYELAQRLMTGRDVERDPYAAFAECAFAAEEGVPGALNMLGYCYVQGVGVMVDEAAALSAFEKAARLGNPVALYNLAICCEQGIGLRQPKPELAAKFMLKAAKAGYGKARAACAYRSVQDG